MKNYDVAATCKNIFKYAQIVGLSDAKLAQCLNITPQAVSKWRKNRQGNSPSIDHLVMLADLFRVSLDELVITVFFEE